MGISTSEACAVLERESGSSSTIAIVFLSLFLVFLVFDTGVSSWAIYKATKTSIQPSPVSSSQQEVDRLIGSTTAARYQSRGSLAFSLKP